MNSFWDRRAVDAITVMNLGRLTGHMTTFCEARITVIRYCKSGRLECRPVWLGIDAKQKGKKL